VDPTLVATVVPEPGQENCGIAAVGLARATEAEVPVLRRQPGTLPGLQLPHGILRHADDQTVLGLSALLRAVADSGRPVGGFSAWGVVFAPRFLGRAATVRALERFDRMGVHGMSPLIIPHLSLHSPAGTLSLALGMHGPNFGVGGGDDHVSEGFLAALAAHAERCTPGLWLVLTAWDPELTTEADGGGSVPAAVHAVALGLVAERAGLSFGVRWTPGSCGVAAAPPGNPSAARLANLAAFLAHENSPGWVCPLAGGGEVRLAARARMRLAG
jgi:hypothetical protein